MFILAIMLGLQQLAKEREEQRAMAAKAEISKQREARESVKESMKSAEIELCLGKQLATKLLVSHNELVSRVTKMRRKFAKQYVLLSLTSNFRTISLFHQRLRFFETGFFLPTSYPVGSAIPDHDPGIREKEFRAAVPF
jgi:flagellar biosynthesis component FlhA